jgi:exopolysaccharide biosynthesis polyprenyl glycosylphosphotransferase
MLRYSFIVPSYLFYPRWLMISYDCSLRKRFFDFVVSALLLVLLSPFLLIIMWLIYQDSPGAVLFSQQRVGKQGKLFTMWKFRSMCLDAEDRKPDLMKDNEKQKGVSRFKMADDPRVTRFGRFIRKYSIDELPQLWNVLIGDMSLVGPRPALPDEVAQYTPYQRHRLEVTQGITCLWQISGRSDIDFPEQVELDLRYIKTQSFFNDILILLKTLPAVLSGRGAK